MCGSDLLKASLRVLREQLALDDVRIQDDDAVALGPLVETGIYGIRIPDVRLRLLAPMK